MVAPSSKWLWLLVVLNSMPALSIERDFNEDIRSAAVAMVGSKGLVVLKSDLAQTRSIHDVVGVDEGANAEEVAFTAKRDSMVERLKSKSVTKSELVEQIEGVLFPVKSRYRPNKLPSREIVIPLEIKQGLSQPVAVVGYDKFSLSWLSLNHHELARIGASVVVTDVANGAQFAEIKSVAPSLSYVPMNADSLLTLSGLKVYPVVLTAANAFQ
ncbi:PFL_4695 family integrating conjugative element protein [Vibrio owensii]|uniref:PFL_4695 family integrating conjugative element protein n=1 Tax=Vibrio owensii TaxID=696485 RepID=UPI0018F12485|nr:integrating conjugative element protein [Vibrio owensii]